MCKNDKYEKHKERLQKEYIKIKVFLKKKKTVEKKAQEIYQNYTEQEQEKRCQYYQESKQKLPEYRKNYHLTHKK